jgi:protein ImuB
MLQHFTRPAADPPDGIVIDSAGADHLHGGEAATLAILVEAGHVGLLRAAIADT